MSIMNLRANIFSQLNRNFSCDAARGVEEIVRLKQTALASATLRVD